MWLSNRINWIISEVQRQKKILMIFLTSDKVLAMLRSWIGTCLVFLHSHSSLGQCVQSPSFMNMYKARGCTMQCTSYAWVEKLQNSYFVNLRIFKVPWGSLYLVYSGIPGGIFRGPRGWDCLRNITTPPWVCIAHAIVVEFINGSFGFICDNSKGHGIQTLIGNMIFQKAFELTDSIGNSGNQLIHPTQVLIFVSIK